MDLGIAGKWALVCGASRGLGLGCAQALVAEGVNVLIVARGAETLAAAATQLIADSADKSGVSVLSVAADITTVEGRAAVFAVRKDFDIVVTNAGGPPPGDFRDWDRDAWIKAVDANMLTPIELIKATVDGMAARGFGRIINITSNAVKAPSDILGLSNGARPSTVVMSAATESTLTPDLSALSAINCVAAAARVSAPRATISTFTPSATSAWAQPRPKPLLAPHTSAHLPAIPKSIKIPQEFQSYWGQTPNSPSLRLALRVRRKAPQ